MPLDKLGDISPNMSNSHMFWLNISDFVLNLHKRFVLCVQLSDEKGNAKNFAGYITAADRNLLPYMEGGE